MELVDARAFLEGNSGKMFYVAFMKSAEEWFPLALVSGSGRESSCLDTLCLSRSYQAMVELVKDCAGDIPQVEQTFVQFLLNEEIRNLLDRYALEKIAVVAPDGGDGGCGCGCGCS